MKKEMEESFQRADQPTEPSEQPVEQAQPPTICDSCQVTLVERAITHEVLRGGERFDIEGVPALECPQCGQRWISSAAMETIDLILKENP